MNGACVKSDDDDDDDDNAVKHSPTDDDNMLCHFNENGFLNGRIFVFQAKAT